MHTGHLASSHSLTFASDSKGFFGVDFLTRLELLGRVDVLLLSCDKELSLLSFAILNIQYFKKYTKISTLTMEKRTNLKQNPIEKSNLRGF